MAACKSEGINPEFRLKIVSFNMHMRRLVSIASIKEESVGTALEYCGHRFML